jgi:hypothetical protein
MRLVYDGETRQYHPATGLDLVPGEHDYPDDKAEQLLAAGLKKPSTRRAAAQEEKE